MVILRALRALRGCEQTRAHPNDRLILDVATLSSPTPWPPPPAEWNRSEDSGEAGGGENIKGGRGRRSRPLPPLSSIPLSAQFLCTESRLRRSPRGVLREGGQGGEGAGPRRRCAWMHGDAMRVLLPLRYVHRHSGSRFSSGARRGTYRKRSAAPNGEWDWVDPKHPLGEVVTSAGYRLICPCLESASQSHCSSCRSPCG